MMTPANRVKQFESDSFRSSTHIVRFTAPFSANVEQSDEIINILTDLVDNPAVVTSDGMELLIPPIWKSLVIKHQYSSRETKAFHILSHIVRLNPQVDFGGSVPQVLDISAKFLCHTSRNVHAGMDFIESLLSHAAERKLDLSSSVNSILLECCSQLRQPQAESWRYLLLASRLFPALTSTAHANTTHESFQVLIKFIVDCLQTNKLLQDDAYRYAIFELLWALSCNSHKSFGWLKDYILATESNGESFAILMTTLTVELRLQLVHFLDGTGQCTAGEKSVKRIESFGSRQTPFYIEPPILHKIILERCLQLYLVGLAEMNRAHDENSEYSSQPLAEYLEDNLAERLWIQLCDLGDVFRTELNRFSRDAVRLINTTSWNCPTVSTASFTREPTSPNSVRDVELIALLITGYLRWIVLYFKTHREGILVQHFGDERVRLLSQLQQRLVEESLNPAMETLCTLLHTYFSNDESTDLQFNRLIGYSLSALASLFTLFPGLPLVPVTSFSRSDRTLADVIFHWIASTLCDRLDHRWNPQSNALVATLVILNSMLLLEPKQSDYLVDLRQALLCATHLGDRLLSAVPQPKTKLSGSMLELCGEVLVLSVCYVREVLHSEQLSQNREHLKAHLMLQLNSYIPILQERFENSEDSSSTLSRLIQALTGLSSVDSSFQSVLGKTADCG
ncbi:hypothetical protein CRM22_008229 [Opisthorchis felineus]|uniref:Uncharacterized protein n=1 Tax=Opisthorchis felineus TaxID=147828 RepID=A0A4S2LCL0_OPIFE|nr:hypothetical protein CRM22_008229 [Opisthorchis felineus]